MKKPIIGLIPLIDEEKDSYWMLPGYMDCIEKAGGLPIMLPLTHDVNDIEEIVQMCDGLVFTGGHDISPELYHDENHGKCGPVIFDRDEMEEFLFYMGLEYNKPMLGICRGIQLFNALLGGTLYQDLPTEHPSTIPHYQKAKGIPYDMPCHKVYVEKDTPLASWINQDEIKVNSYHHQAIKKLSEEFKAMAYSEDGLVEAIYHPNKKFVMAIQWHPEFNYLRSPESYTIIQKFIESTKTC